VVGAVVAEHAEPLVVQIGLRVLLPAVHESGFDLCDATTRGG
jgi:hypothetical protein